jgi:hypothetical protein
MSARHLLGVRQDAAGRIAPVFAAPDIVLDAVAHHRAVVGELRTGGFAPAAYAAAPMDLATRLAARAREASAAVALQATSVELGVRIIRHPATIASQQPKTGADFLRQSAERLRRQDASETIAAAIASLVDAASLRRLASDASMIALAIRVERADARALASAIEATATPEVAVDVTGPWPLYSFGLAEVLS